jgi:RNA polymerase subunit RPABC4/transcription elongation factor Spt4
MILTDEILAFIEEEHICPHCNTRMTPCHTPPLHVGDGLGWGSPVFMICLNNECSLYKKSWQEFEDNYGHVASCRYMLLPGADKGEPIMVASCDAYTGCVIDVEEEKRRNRRWQKEQEAAASLDTCVADGDLEPVMLLILDENAKVENRERACALLDRINDIACVDPIRNHVFRHTEIGQLANMAVDRILKSHNLKECPHCAELVKAKAKVCKHCGRDI